ncbi:hypothetical protein [Isoptericola sp. NPDC055881]
MTDPAVEPSGDPEPVAAPKPNPRAPWSACGICYAVVVDLELHTAASHPITAEPAPADTEEP